MQNRHCAVLLSCLAASTIHIGWAEFAFVSQKLDAKEIEETRALALRVRESLNKGTETGSAPTDFLKPDERWYKPIDFKKQPRFNAIGALFFIPVLARHHEEVKTDGKTQTSYCWTFGEHFGRCTAFYVAPDILATSTHCLRETASLTPDTLNRVIFRREYDTEQALDAKEVEKHERIITEWIYLSGYGVDETKFKDLTLPKPGMDEHEKKKKKQKKDPNDVEKPGKHHYGLDFAFLRTDRPCFDCVPYTLVNPDLVMPKKAAPEKTPEEEKKFKKAIKEIKKGKQEVKRTDTPHQSTLKRSQSRLYLPAIRTTPQTDSTRPTCSVISRRQTIRA